MSNPESVRAASFGVAGSLYAWIFELRGGVEKCQGDAALSACYLPELQLRHSTLRLVMSLLPPIDRGTMWSTVRSAAKPQNEHQGCKRLSSLDKRRHLLSYPRLLALSLVVLYLAWHCKQRAQSRTKTPQSVQGLIIVLVIVSTKNVIDDAHSFLRWQGHIRVKSGPDGPS